MVTSTESRRAVWSSQQRVDLARGEEADLDSLGALGGDRENALDKFRVLGVAQRCEAEQRVNRGQPGIAGAHIVAAVVFEVGEKGSNEVGIENGEVKTRWRRTGPVSGECQQEPERIAVRRDGVRARSTFVE